MFQHISIGVKDIERSREFYDKVLGPLGYERLVSVTGRAGYGAESPKMWLFETPSPVPRDPKSGLHFCFNASSKEAVDDFHAAGIATGGEDNGPPGVRPEYATFYYAAFLIDPDGYRIEAFFHLPE